MNHHHRKKKKKSNINAAATSNELFHPSIMFCGECSGCNTIDNNGGSSATATATIPPPPPPISSALFTNILPDDEETPPPSRNNSISLHTQQNVSSSSVVHLRVYNIHNTYNTNNNNARKDGEGAIAMGRVDILKTILADLNGVQNVTISDSHYLSSPSPPTNDDQFSSSSTTTPTIIQQEEQRRRELIDPTSCMVKVEYYHTSSPLSTTTTTITSITTNNTSSLFNISNDSETAIVTDNPQEPKEDEVDNNDTIRQSILNRLDESGFDYALVSSSSPSSSPHDGSGILPNTNISNNNNSSMTYCQSISNNINNEPPSSVRTRLRVGGICCSSEVPIVRSIIKPLPGVRKVGINVATKVVFIDHDPTIITATLLVRALNDERFDAVLLNDGGLELKNANNNDDSRTAEPLSSSMELLQLESIPKSKFVESTYFIPGMLTYTSSHQNNNDNKKLLSCPISKVLQQNFFKDSLRAFHLHGPSRTLKVEHDPNVLSASKIRNVLVQGLTANDVGNEWGNIELAHDGHAEGLILPELSSNNTNNNDAQQDMNEEGGGDLLLNKGEQRRRKYCPRGLKINVIISGIFWILSLLSFIGGIYDNLKYAGIGSVLFGMPPVVYKAYLTVKRYQFDANCMMVMAAFGALILGEFDEAASVSFLFAVSEYLEARASGKARRALGEIISLRPEYAHVVNDRTGEIVIVPAVNIPVGTVVSVRTGDKCPADGVVVEGMSSVDESSLTGEARPVEKREGDDMAGGSINVGSRQLVVRTTSTVGDSTLSRLIQLVEEAQANTSETEKLVDAFARKYTPVVLVIAFFLCTVPWFFGRETGRYWMLNGLIIIVIACPCALQISTPVTYSAGLAAAAQRGIIIKGGSKLEALGNVKTVLFDKTGTITTGRFALSHLDVVGNAKTRKEVLELLAIMEAPSSHPLSACLVSAAKEEGIVMPTDFSLTEHTILKGEGVTALVDNKRVYVGNERLFKRVEMYNLSSEQSNTAKEWSDEGGTVGYIGIDNMGIVGMFCVKDTIRDESHDVITSLLDKDIEVIMLTGDGDGAAQAVGKEVGLAKTSIQSQLLPEDKLHYISGLKGAYTASKLASLLGKKKLILFVGDGVNDAPALTVADVGVAMGSGASLALEMSDVTLMDSNLSKLLFSMRMGSKVITTVKENITFSLVINFVAVVLTFLGKMSLLWAIVSDVGVMLLVTLNGMKLLSKRTIDAIEGGRKANRTASKRKNGQRYNMPPIAGPELELI